MFLALLITGSVMWYICIMVLCTILFLASDREPGKPVDDAGIRINMICAALWPVMLPLFCLCTGGEAYVRCMKRFAIHPADRPTRQQRISQRTAELEEELRKLGPGAVPGSRNGKH